ncbi:MAG: hypothetical protein XXXJIFNMEKO3_03186 [Candidatus Erwinia impunctatus]|nr:hypothetical protein XXXJIFNMEKO_03186 [Culicoides impunctatus]
MQNLFSTFLMPVSTLLLGFLSALLLPVPMFSVTLTRQLMTLLSLSDFGSLFIMVLGM